MITVPIEMLLALSFIAGMAFAGFIGGSFVYLNGGFEFQRESRHRCSRAYGGED